MEAGLAFAALHELLWPVTDRLDTLPEPQAAALRGALGLSGETANRFLIGAAVLSLVSDLARRRPVLVVVDDVQWIDEASAHALGFLARRVASDPVLVLLAGRQVRVNCIAPGCTSTSMIGDDPEVVATLSERALFGRLAAPEEIAQAAIYLWSSASSFMTGAVLDVNGGIRL